MTITIRPLVPADRAQWHPLWRAYLAFYETDLPPQQDDLTWSRLLGDDTEMHGLCAVDGEGRLCGLVHYLYHGSTWLDGDACYLQDLYVDPATRGHGIGRALMDAVYTAADAHGAAQVYWLTQDTNTTARTLYDQVGKVTPFVKYKRV